MRKKIDPCLPSRLSAVFAFGLIKDAVAAARRSKRLINDVHEFELMDHPLTRVVRANFEIVTLLRQVINAASWDQTQLEGLADHYWRQGGALAVQVPDPWKPGKFKDVTANVTWEYLIEGRLDRVGGPLGF